MPLESSVPFTERRPLGKAEHESGFLKENHFDTNGSPGSGRPSNDDKDLCNALS